MPNSKIEIYKELVSRIYPHNLPRHISIIMDGNGRWAQKRGLSRIEGHKAGLKALEEILEFNRFLKIPFLTVYAFSRENWKRNKKEVESLMSLALEAIKDNLKNFKEKDIKFLHLGEIDLIDEKLSRYIKELEETTKNGSTYTFCAAFNYGGRLEILKAFEKLYKDLAEGITKLSNISEESFYNYLYHPEVPDIDLVIRTSGEFRLSNFMLWRCAYAEFYFSDILWPDFSPSDLVEAISSYQKRKRRFGGN